jgi:hypothetical protein
VLFWPWDQIRAANERWPTTVRSSDTESLVRRRELESRQLVEQERVRIVMVPITVTQLLNYAARTDGDPLDPVTRTEALRERYQKV